MGTKSSTGKGTTLSIGSGGTSETFTPIMQVKQYQFSGVQAKYEDVTNLDSPTVGAAIQEESISSTVSPGQLKLSGLLLPSDAGQAALYAAFKTQSAYDFKLQLGLASGQTTAGNLYTFSAYVQDPPLPETIDYSKPITFSTTLKLNTMPTLTVGS